MAVRLHWNTNTDKTDLGVIKDYVEIDTKGKLCNCGSFVLVCLFSLRMFVFPLSAFLNSGIRNVALKTKEWVLDFLFHPHKMQIQRNDLSDF